MDSAPAHKNHLFKKSISADYNTILAMVPGGLTPLIQPLDVYINRSFKNKLREKYTDWMISGIYLKNRRI